MAYWRWNEGRSSAEIREQVLIALLERGQLQAGHQTTGDDIAL